MAASVRPTTAWRCRRLLWALACVIGVAVLMCAASMRLLRGATQQPPHAQLRTAPQHTAPQHTRAAGWHGLHHVSLLVRDLAASRDFYTRAFGLREIPSPAYGFDQAWFDMPPDGELHLLPASGQRPSAADPSLVHLTRPNTYATHVGVAIEWAHKQRLVRRVRGYGLPVTERVDPGGARHHLYVHDPDGHVWDLTSTLELEQGAPVEQLLPGSAGAEVAAGADAPGTSSGVEGSHGKRSAADAGADTRVESRHGAAAAGNPLVTSAALDVLAMHGATAADAAIAAAVVDAVVEPMNAGLGGDMHATVFEFDAAGTTGDSTAATRAPRGIPGARVEPGVGWMYALDASGRSPAGVTRARFDAALEQRCGGVNGSRVPLSDIPAYCPLAITVPGAVSGMCELHARFGRIPFARLFDRGIALARDGFVVSEHSARNWHHAYDVMARREGLTPALRRDFAAVHMLPRRSSSPSGSRHEAWRAPEAGDVFRNPALAKTLQRLALGGCGDFYSGVLAARISTYLRQHGALVNGTDLTQHTAEWKVPLHADFNGTYAAASLWTLPPPTQGVTALQLLKVLQATAATFRVGSGTSGVRGGGGASAGPAADERHLSPQFLHTFIEAIKAVYAVRADTGGSGSAGDAASGTSPLLDDALVERVATHVRRSVKDGTAADVAREYPRDYWKEGDSAQARRVLRGRSAAAPVPVPGDGHGSGHRGAAGVGRHGDSVVFSGDKDGVDLPGRGDTVSLSVSDRGGMVVSLLASMYTPFGSAVTVPSLGMALQSRGALFSLERSQHPNVWRPGARPFHTLMPSIAVVQAHATKGSAGGTSAVALAVKGGNRQPMATVQVLLNAVEFGLPWQAATDAPRLRHRGSRHPAHPASASGITAHERTVTVAVAGGWGPGVATTVGASARGGARGPSGTARGVHPGSACGGARDMPRG